MLTLWYIILGWKEYNKPFTKVGQPQKPGDPAKKPDLIPLKKDAPPTKPTDTKTPTPPAPITPKPAPPRTPEPPLFNNKPSQPPKAPEPKPTLPSPKTPDPPKLPPTTPEIPKSAPKTPDLPTKPEPPKLPPRTPELPKLPDFKLAPEPPQKPQTPDLPKPTPTPQPPPKTIPSRSPDPGMPDIPFSSKNPAYVPPPNQSDFPLPPYLPGAPPTKPTSKDDQLFATGTPSPTPNNPSATLRDLSYSKGEFPGEDVVVKVKETISRIPKYMEQSVISNPDSLESDSDEDF